MVGPERNVSPDDEVWDRADARLNLGLARAVGDLGQPPQDRARVTDVLSGRQFCIFLEFDLTCLVARRAYSFGLRPLRAR